MKKLAVAIACALAGAALPVSASAAPPKFGLSTESPAVFRSVQQQIPVSYWSPFIGWRGANEFNVVLQQAKSFHATPMISWETWDARERIPSKRVKPAPGLSARSIAIGKQDRYIKRQARYIKSYKRTVYLRFDHEMNGNWYPWSGNSAYYKRMWIRTHNIFRKLGVKNAKFIWSPNLNTYEQDGVFDKRVKAYYPGDKYVDVIGSTITRVQAQGSCYQSPAWFFMRLDRLRALYPNRPMWITESLVDLEELQTWMPYFRQEIDARPYIRAVNWLSTVGPQQPSFGNMNWALNEQPFALQYLKFANGYQAPPPAVPGPGLC